MDNQKHNTATPLFVGLLVLLAGSGCATLWLSAVNPTGDSERLVRLEQETRRDLAALEQKLDRLSSLAPSAPSAGHAAVMADTQALRPPAQALTQQQAQARQAQVRFELDKRFESQPVDAHWSLESARRIERSLAPDSLEAIGASPPAASDIDCRSSMCRIHLVYGDLGSATDAGTMLNMTIADRMPHTQILSQPRSDGGIDYFIYAMREPSR